MISRVFVIFGILLALLGFVVVPGIFAGRMRRRPPAIHRSHADDGDLLWDLAGWVPLGILDRRERVIRREWTFVPGFRRIK